MALMMCSYHPTVSGLCVHQNALLRSSSIIITITIIIIIIIIIIVIVIIVIFIWNRVPQKILWKLRKFVYMNNDFILGSLWCHFCFHN